MVKLLFNCPKSLQSQTMALYLCQCKAQVMALMVHQQTNWAEKEFWRATVILIGEHYMPCVLYGNDNP